MSLKDDQMKALLREASGCRSCTVKRSDGEVAVLSLCSPHMARATAITALPPEPEPLPAPEPVEYPPED